MLLKVALTFLFFLTFYGFFEAQGHFTYLDTNEVSEARWGTLPLFNVSVYMNTIFEPHNAIVHVSQNFLNFLMYTIFWVTAGALYYKVNPIVGSRRDKDAYDYEYYLVVDESSPFFHLNSTDLISSNSLAIREEPKMYRRKREVDTNQIITKESNPIKTLASSLRGVSKFVKSSADFLSDLW